LIRSPALNPTLLPSTSSSKRNPILTYNMKTSKLQKKQSILLLYALSALTSAFEFPWTQNGGIPPASNSVNRQPSSMDDFDKYNTFNNNSANNVYFGRQSFQFPSNRRDEKIESVKDVDAELFGEIERALMRAAIDLEDGSVAFRESPGEAPSNGPGAEGYIHKAVQDVAQWERILEEEEEQQKKQFENTSDDPIESMARAYQAALDAAQESIHLLTEQIQALEMELSTTKENVNVSMRERERLQEEYNFLAKQALQLSHALMEIRQEQREMTNREYPDIQQFRQ